MRTLALALILLAPVAAQTPRPMTTGDVLAVQSVGGVKISPDGKLVLYEVAYPDLADDRGHTEIWLAPASGSPAGIKARRFTSGREDKAAEWSPDGQWVAFLRTSRDNGAPAGETPRAQIYVMPAFGGEADPLTEGKGGVTAFAWSPDSKRIAFVAGVPLTEAQEKDQKDKNDTRVIDGDYRFSHLWVIDVASKKAGEVVKIDGVLADPQWSPDGSRLAYVSRPTPKADDGTISDIYVVASAAGSASPRKIFENEGPDDSPRWSPDGKWIAFNSRDNRHGVLGVQHLMVMGSDGGSPRDLTPDPASTASDIRWSPDGSSLYYRSALHTTAQIFRVALKGGAPEALTHDEAVINSFSLSHAADRVAFARSDLQHAPELYVSAFPKLDAQRVTDHNALVRDLALGKSEVVHWRGKDGLDLEGILIYPAGYQTGKKVPLIASIHGGPSGAWSQAFPHSGNGYAQVWAGKGWAVFLPNIRGSSGYGEKFQLANLKDWGGMDYQDIQSGLDELVRRGIADPDRMVQSGWSYGGYMTAWTLTQTNRFKAVVVGAGLTDMFSMYSTNDLQRVLEGYFGDAPWNDLESYRRASAMTFIKQAKTPTLIMHGAADTRVPVGQAQELYMGLRKNNVPVEMVVFPRENHGFIEPRHILDKMQRETAFIEKYLK
ncbi:MAG: S9 family peptidase [Acidobacteriia bacterium]|nr:S9 family peptidase [Terriglobia bacterium]